MSIRLFQLMAILLLPFVARSQTPVVPPGPDPATGAPSIPVTSPSDTPADSAGTPPVEITPPVAPPACFPNCREGYICYQGGCVYACNPVCAQGYGCLSNGQCVLMPPELQSSAPPVNTWVDPAVALKQQRAREKQAARAARLALRMDYRREPRFALHAKTTFIAAAEMEIIGLGGVFGLGFRKNFVNWFGLQFRVSTTLGVLMVDDSSSNADSEDDDSMSDSTFVGAVDGELIPYFGPFGRFYIGPILFVGGVWPNDETLTTTTSGGTPISIYSIPSGVYGGAGLDMGIMLGAREQIDINWNFKSAFFTDNLPFIFQVGVAFHFMNRN